MGQSPGTRQTRRQTMTIRKAMTLFEFLIVVIVIVALALILMPSLSSTGRVSHRTVCATNLKSIGSVLAIYADGSQDHLPIFPATKNLQWLCDESHAFFTTAVGIAQASTAQSIQTEGIRKWFYCPDNTTQDHPTLESWNAITITGYIFFNNRGKDATSMPQIFPKRPPEAPALQYHDQLMATENPTDTELAADWIISNSDDSAKATFTKIDRPGSPPLQFSTSHLNGKKPSGANILAFDCHVAWRPFTPAKATPIKQPGPSPAYFWLPNP